MPEDKRDLELRRTFKQRLLTNPNYFGNLKELKLTDLPDAQDDIVSNVTYEELTCVGLNPDTDVLTAIVRIKRGGGYLGDICEGGSREYVRFYLDYGDGTWVDSGLASFEAHDLGFDEDLCYAVSIALDPERRTCCDRDPVLPEVRAILSWNIAPPANTPNWLPVWGNRIERHVQIDPRPPWQCWILQPFEAGTLKIDPSILELLQKQITQIPKPPLPPQPLPELVQIAKKDDDKLGPLRAVFPIVAKLAEDDTDIAAHQALKALAPLEIEFGQFNEFILKPDFNTTYEELHCVGLDRDMTTLHGVVQIKRPSGYSGNLCSQGSRQYIAFYLDFGSGWEYQGTTWVQVHDIQPMPKGGLWYQAQLKVDLDDQRKEWCEAGLARIRGILSWSVPPAPNQPNFVPHWGDREDCHIEVRPLPEGVPGGVLTPVLQSIGSMPVNLIDGGGFATGPGIVASINAEDSPFGGTINLAGEVFSTGGAALEYRVMVRGPSDAAFSAATTSFGVVVNTVTGGSSTFANVTQTPNGDWFPYIPQSGAVSKSVVGDLLYPFRATEDGLHTVYVQVRNAGVMPPIATSALEVFYVNNTRPSVDVEITSGAGNCGKFGVGEVVSGSFSMTADFADFLTISVTPGPEAGGGTLVIPSAAPAGAAAVFPITDVSGTSTAVTMGYRTGVLDTTGVAIGAWELDTTGMEPCGYNIRIYAEDRTIVNSANIGWAASDIEGFCVDD